MRRRARSTRCSKRGEDGSSSGSARSTFDRSGDAGEQATEIQAIENLAEHLRNEGAGEATITKEIAKLTAGREADLERNTQAQAEHEQYIDKVLEQQRQRLLDEEHRANQTKDASRDPTQPEPSDPVPDHQPEPERIERDPYIEQAIQEERDRQQAFEQEIERERDNDLGLGLSSYGGCLPKPSSHNSTMSSWFWPPQPTW